MTVIVTVVSLYYEHIIVIIMWGYVKTCVHHATCCVLYSVLYTRAYAEEVGHMS